MGKLIPSSIMKDYFMQKAVTLDEYNSFRRIFSYQYGTACALHYVLGLDIGLNNLIFDMKTGCVHINNLKFNFDNQKVSPYSLRLSRNVFTFLDKILMNSGILPAFSATIDALNNKKFNFKNYSNLIHKDLGSMQN